MMTVTLSRNWLSATVPRPPIYTPRFRQHDKNNNHVACRQETQRNSCALLRALTCCQRQESWFFGRAPARWWKVSVSWHSASRCKSTKLMPPGAIRDPNRMPFARPARASSASTQAVRLDALVEPELAPVAVELLLKLATRSPNRSLAGSRPLPWRSPCSSRGCPAASTGRLVDTPVRPCPP